MSLPVGVVDGVETFEGLGEAPAGLEVEGGLITTIARGLRDRLLEGGPRAGQPGRLVDDLLGLAHARLLATASRANRRVPIMSSGV